MPSFVALCYFTISMPSGKITTEAISVLLCMLHCAAHQYPMFPTHTKPALSRCDMKYVSAMFLCFFRNMFHVL